MKLQGVSISNYRSITGCGDIRIESLQAFVGENNAGKSNILRSVEAFLTPGAGGIQESDFFTSSDPIIIKAIFTDISAHERKALRPYLLGDKLILEKHISLKSDPKSSKPKLSTEYHGYMAKPKEWWLSTERVIERDGARPNWKKIAEDNGILEYVQQNDGKVTKASYEAGVSRFLQEKEDIEYEEPSLGDTQALGLQAVLLSHLPRFYLLPAITDYSTEIAQRSTTTTFRRLMGDLADRILKADPRYGEVEASLQKIRCLLNPPGENEERTEDLCRLETLGTVEGKLQEAISKLMPSVEAVSLEVTLGETKEFFSKGVSLKIDDGVLTDVLAKGHGLQRSVVFALLQILISLQRGQLVSAQAEDNEPSSIILAIEEPELYIHPQMQRTIFSVLREFSKSDQVMYTTHAPAFVDVAAYECIALVKKEAPATGTIVCQCDPGILGSLEDRKGFQLLTSFGLEHNQVFFAKKAVLVEGEQDLVALIAGGRSLGIFAEFPEEVGFSIIVTENKDQVPKFQRLLNAFQIPYVVWLELDGKNEEEEKNKRIIDLLCGNRCVKLPNRLEEAAGHTGHFSKTYDAKKYFENTGNMIFEFQDLVKEVFG